MSESPEVERNYNNPNGKSNLEKGAEPPTKNVDRTDPVQAANENTIKKPSNPKMPPSGNLEYAGQSDNTTSS